MSELKEAALVALRDCLDLKEGERTLIVTDPILIEIGTALFSAATHLGGKPILLETPVGRRDGEEPPEPVADMMRKMDIVLAPTTKSISHTEARREASKAGARIATLPGITPEIMCRTMSVEYRTISKISKDLARILTETSRVKVTSPRGTSIEMSIEGRSCLADTGLIHAKGDFSNLPAGEAYLAPVEGTANGVVVVDGSMAGIGKLSEGEEIRLHVADGKVYRIEGGEKAEKLEELISSVGEEGKNIAELGIGTNDKAIVSGVVLEDEKVLGTVHIAVGNNLSMGGNVDVPLHLDGVLLNPTVEVDGEVLLREGKVKI